MRASSARASLAEILVHAGEEKARQARGGISAPLNYRGFPKPSCTSINHVVCHGIPPTTRRLKEGDIVSIDVTPIVEGRHDSSRMYTVCKIKVKAQKLIDVTFEAMWKGIEAVRPGARVGDIGHAIQSFVEARQFSVVRDFCGRGLGRIFHDAPNIPHYGEPNTGPELRQGMFFAIEPMINAGRWEVKILKDGWTAVTHDRSLSAQFEHSIGVTADGCEVFTRRPDSTGRPTPSPDAATARAAPVYLREVVKRAPGARCHRADLRSPINRPALGRQRSDV